MKKVFWGIVVSISMGLYAEEPSIKVNLPSSDGFSQDTYIISAQNESPLQSMILLSLSALESVCYQGEINEVKKILDSTAVKAGSKLKRYSSFIDSDKLMVDINVYNYVGELQRVALEIEACN